MNVDKPDLIVVDVETTGLYVDRHVVIEVAAINARTGDALYFVPNLHPYDLGCASADALRINRYFERGVFKDELSPPETRNKYEQLWDMLRGNTFGGANARFDADMLRHGYGRLAGTRETHGPGNLRYAAAEEPWSYRLADLGSYAAGVLGEDPAEPLSLSEVCRRVGIERDEAHTALADARAAAECFRRLNQLISAKNNVISTKEAHANA